MRHFVLIVDDKAKFLTAFAETCTKWCRSWGLEVVARSSAEKARAFLRTHGGMTELVIVDIRLPTTRKGSGLLSYVKAKYPTVRRIAITAVADRDEVGAMAATQLFHGYIDKDWWAGEHEDRDRVRGEIKRVLNEPCDPSSHSGIVAAMERWLEQDPSVKEKKLTSMDGDTKTIGQLFQEIKRGTPLGKKQERAIFRMACDLFSSKSDTSR